MGHFAGRLIIERSPLRAVSEHTLRNLEDVFARHQRPVLAKAQVERFRTVDPADLVNVTKTLRCNERGLGALAFDDRIHDNGSTMYQQRSRIERNRRLGERFLDPLGQFRRRRERLRQCHRTLRFVEYHYVRKRAADVYSYAQCILPLPILDFGF